MESKASGPALSGDHARPGTIELGHHAPHLAVVTLRGEHDLSTLQALTRGLERAAAHSNVLVDLSDCTFIDSTVVMALIRTAREVQARGETLALVIPSQQPHVARLAALMRLADIFPVHTSREAGLTSLAQAHGATP